MNTIRQTQSLMLEDPENNWIYMMDFVDDFRYYKESDAIKDAIVTGKDADLDALLASVVEYLCDEIGSDAPGWTASISACKDPYFVHGMENLKAISVVESPLRFRIRKIFVLENFLSRV